MSTEKSTKTIDGHPVTEATDDAGFWAGIGFAGGIATAPIIAAIVFTFCWICFCCTVFFIAILS